jgi:hypothetical protein
VYFTLRDPASRANGCTGTNGFDDIRPGGTVTLTDESGKVIGSGTFGKAYTSASTIYVIPKTDCLWIVTMRGVPRNATQYTVHIGNSQRQPATESRQALAGNDWNYVLRIGD